MKFNLDSLGRSVSSDSDFGYTDEVGIHAVGINVRLFVGHGHDAVSARREPGHLEHAILATGAQINQRPGFQDLMGELVISPEQA